MDWNAYNELTDVSSMLFRLMRELMTLPSPDSFRDHLGILWLSRITHRLLERQIEMTR